MKFLKNDKKRGFLVLTMVLIVCATVLAIIVGVMLRSIGEVNSTADSEKSLQAWGAVNACGEYALVHMMGSTTSTTTTAANWGWTGDFELTNVGGGGKTCYIYPIGAGVAAGSKLIKASSTVSGFTRKIQIEVSTNTPDILINSWQAVADF